VCETDAGYTQDLGRTQSADCLQAHPNLSVIASQADESTRGAESSITDAGQTFGLGPKDIKLVSAYASTYGVAQVRAGKWVQTSYNRPQGTGRAAVRLLLLAMEGKKVPDFIDQADLDALPTILTKDVLDKHPEILGQWAG
jgi:ribose transport system substrate-binding protein